MHHAWPNPPRRLASAFALGLTLTLGCKPDPTVPPDRTAAPSNPPVMANHRTETPIAPDAPPTLDLDRFAGSHRPLLIFADSPDRPDLIRQRRLLAEHRPGLADREMLVVEIIGPAVTLDGQPVPADARKLRRQHNLPDDAPFALRLVGKDTGVKLRSDRPVAAERLFALIDAMPMRRREIAERRDTP
ncbi:MAG: DUF4174 domain-containing protein [Planctomycetota bacterium]